MKRSKKILSLVISFFTVFSMLMPASVQAATISQKAVTPIIAPIEEVDLKIEPTSASVICVNDNWAGLANGTVVTREHNCPRTTVWTIGANATSTIQNGIQLVLSGGTVYVEAGNYYGVSTIDKGMILRGDVVSTIGAGSYAPVIRESIDGSDVIGYGINIANGVDNVEIAGFKVIDFGPVGSNYSAGIGSYNTSTDPIVNVIVHHNTVENIDGAGIDFWNIGTSIFSNINVYLNKITIRPNNPTVPNYDGSTFGIECSNCSNSVIRNNTVQGAKVGIMMKADSTAENTTVFANSNRISSNTVNEAETGISIYGDIAATNGAASFGDILVRSNIITNPLHTDISGEENRITAFGISAYATDRKFLSRFRVNGTITISGNTITGDGVKVNTAGVMAGVENVTITTNNISQLKKGIINTRLATTYTGLITNLRILNNNIHDLTGYIDLEPGYPAEGINLGYESALKTGPSAETKVNTLALYNGLRITGNTINNVFDAIKLRGITTNDGVKVAIVNNNISAALGNAVA